MQFKRAAIKELDENILILIKSRNYKDDMIQQLNGREITDYRVYSLFESYQYNNNERFTYQGQLQIYNYSKIEKVMTLFEIGGYGSWTKEMLKITDVGNTILEIRCGVGEKSVALAKMGTELRQLIILR